MQLESKFGFDLVKIRDSSLTGRIQEIIALEDGRFTYRVAVWVMGIELKHFIVAEWELSLIEDEDAKPSWCEICGKYHKLGKGECA